MARLRRIEALLNASLSDVAYADLQRLVTGRVLEDVDIDFKSEPHKDGQDLAVDVSAMANTVGGVLVIGMAEAEGAATELKPCPLSDDDTNRMRQWLAELVVPYISTDIVRVPEAPGGGRTALQPIPADAVWLAMALMPDAPGAMTIDAPQLRRVRHILAAGLADGPFRSAPRALTTGVGRVIAINAYEHGTTRPRFGYAEFHADGGGFVAAELHNAQQQGATDKHPVVRLDDVQVVRTGLGLLRMLTDHATSGAGTHGDAVARCELLMSAGDVRLGYHDGGIFDAYDTARVLRSAPIVGNHTVSLDAIGDSRVEWLAGGRLLLMDLFHAFGVPEVPQITNEGHLRRPYWRRTNIETIAAFAGVPISDQSVDFYF